MSDEKFFNQLIGNKLVLKINQWNIFRIYNEKKEINQIDNVDVIPFISGIYILKDMTDSMSFYLTPRSKMFITNYNALTFEKKALIEKFISENKILFEIVQKENTDRKIHLLEHW